jgi:hypothetical protein
MLLHKNLLGVVKLNSCETVGEIFFLPRKNQI